MDALTFSVWTAWRGVRARPVLPLLAVGVLTLGIGSSTAVLGVAYAALVRPLPYPSPAELVVVTSNFPGLTNMGLSGPEATELGTLTTGFRRGEGLVDLGFGYQDQLTVSVDGATSRPARVAVVSAGLLRALRPVPLRGRLFDAGDDRPNGPSVAVLAHAFWDQQLGADAHVVGRVLTIDGRRVEVVGVMPPAVDFAGRAVDLWIPLQYDVTSPSANRANHVFTVVGRRRADLTLAGLTADLIDAESRWSATVHQFHTPDPRFHPLAITPLVETVRGPVTRATLVLSFAVVLVLVIAAGNAALLLIAAADARQTELSVRSALGAGPAQLFGVVAAEAGLLSMAAMAGGLLFAEAASRAIGVFAPAALANIHLTLAPLETIAIAAIVTASTALACAAGPILRIRRMQPGAALSAESRTGTAAPRRQRARRTMVAVEVALAVSLFSSAALMVESFWRLSHVVLGFTPEGVTHASITLPAAGYRDRARIDAFYGAVMTRLRSAPGVTHVGVLSGLPPDRRANNTSFQFDGEPADMHTGRPPMQFLNFTSPDAFAALGITLEEGRLPTAADTILSQPVAVLNAEAARAYFPGGSAVGRRLRMFGAGLPWMTVVGVVSGVRQHGLNRDIGTEIFIPIGQADNAMGAVMTRDLDLVVRAASGADVAAAIRSAAREADPAAAISAVASMDAIVGDSIGTTRFLTYVLAAFAGVALLLCASGVYGTVSNDVGARMTEIGVRRSLGAGAAAITGLVAQQSGVMIAAGLLMGVAAATAANRAVASLTFGITTTTPERLAVTALALGLAAAAACVLPLLRALRIDPARVLRR